MADEFDGCECVWTSQEFAMQRLLNFIRRNQNHCTDTECIDVSGRALQQSRMSSTDGSDGYVVMALMIIGLLMYFLSPSVFNYTTNKRNSRRPGQDPHDDSASPPAPPAVN